MRTLNPPARYQSVLQWNTCKIIAHVLDELRPNASRAEWLYILVEIDQGTRLGERYLQILLSHFSPADPNTIRPDILKSCRLLADTIRSKP
jgi:hypothetical protein